MLERAEQSLYKLIIPDQAFNFFGQPQRITDRFVIRRLTLATLGIAAAVLTAPAIAEAQARNPYCEIRPQVFVQAYQDVDGDNQYRPNTQDVLLGGIPNQRILVSAGGISFVLITYEDGKGVYTDPKTGIKTDYAPITAPSNTTLNGQPALETLIEDLETKNKLEKRTLVCKGSKAPDGSSYTGVSTYYLYGKGDPNKSYGSKVGPQGRQLPLVPAATEPVQNTPIPRERATGTPQPDRLPTSTIIPTQTPSPNEVLRTQIAQAQVTATQEKELAGLRRTATALAEQIEAVRGTPSRTPTPIETPTPTIMSTTVATPASTSEALARRVEEAKKQLEEEQKIVIAKGTATALAKQLSAIQGTPTAKTGTGGEEALEQLRTYDLGLAAIIGGVGTTLSVLQFLVRYVVAKYRFNKAVAGGGPNAPGSWHRPSVWKIWQWKSQ